MKRCKTIVEIVDEAMKIVAEDRGMTAKDRADDDGYIRVIKVAKHKMKSFTSDFHLRW